jgi:hypothetical protein
MVTSATEMSSCFNALQPKDGQSDRTNLLVEYPSYDYYTHIYTPFLILPLYPNLSASSNSFSTLNLSSPFLNHSNNLLLSSALSLPIPSSPATPSHPP